MITHLANRSFYARAALFGALLYFIVVAVYFALDLVFFAGAYIADDAMLLVSGLIVAASLAFIRRWGFVVGILGGALGLVGFSEDIDVVLAAPYAFFNFAPAVTLLVAFAIILVASIAGLLESFRGVPRVRAGKLELAALRGMTGALIVLAVVSAIATAANAGGVAAAEKDGAVVVSARNAEWEVKLIQARVGEPVRILVKNDDPVLHTFTIYDLGIDLKLGPWSEDLIVIERPEGNLGFVCRIFGHEKKMTGAIVGR